MSLRGTDIRTIKVHARGKTAPRRLTDYQLFIADVLGGGFRLHLYQVNYPAKIEDEKRESLLARVGERKDQIKAYLDDDNGEKPDYVIRAQKKRQVDNYLCTEILAYIAYTDLLNDLKVTEYPQGITVYLPIEVKDEGIDEIIKEQIQKMESSELEGDTETDTGTETGTGTDTDTDTETETETETETGTDGKSKYVKWAVGLLCVIVILLLFFKPFSCREGAADQNDVDVNDPNASAVSPQDGDPLTDANDFTTEGNEEGSEESSKQASHEEATSETGIHSESDTQVIKDDTTDARPIVISVSQVTPDGLPPTPPRILTDPPVPGDKPPIVDMSAWFERDNLSYKISILLPPEVGESEIETEFDDSARIERSHYGYMIDLGKNKPERYQLKCRADNRDMCTVRVEDGIVVAELRDGVKLKYGYEFSGPNHLSTEDWKNVGWIKDESAAKTTYEEYTRKVNNLTRKCFYWEIDNSRPQIDLGLSLRHLSTGATLPVDRKRVQAGRLSD